MLTANLGQREDIPHEQGEWMELAPLSWRERKRARDNRVREYLDLSQKLPAAQVSKATEDAEDRETDDLDPDMFDHLTVLRAGVKAWSYKAKLNADTLSDLDAQTAEWAVTRILERTRPDEAAAGEGAGGSSST